MRKVQVTVYLEGEHADLLDTFAARTRLSRSAYVSRLIELDLGAAVERIDRDLRFATAALRVLLEHADPTFLGRAESMAAVPSAGSV